MSEENTQTVVVDVPSTFQSFKDLVAGIEVDVTKFYTKGTASAAARARKKLSALSRLNKELRKVVQSDKKVKVAARKAKKTEQAA